MCVLELVLGTAFKCSIFMQRRLAIKQEEIDDDFSYARELREREKRLKALEEELEKKAR